MSIVLVCGTEYARLDYVQNLLEKCGVEGARNSKRDDLSARQITSSILTANKANLDSDQTVKQIKPGRAWELIASELLVSNLTSADWGWADSNSVFLLDYWKEFDPSTRFIIVYSSPERALTEILQQGISDEDAIDACVARWKIQNAELLKFYKKNKSRCLLVDISQIERNEVEFIDQVRRRKIADVNLEIDPFFEDLEGYVADSDEFAGAGETPLVDPAITDFVTSAFLSDDASLLSLYSEIDGWSDLSVAPPESEVESGPSDLPDNSTGIDNRKHNIQPFLDGSGAVKPGPSKEQALGIYRSFLALHTKGAKAESEITRLRSEREELETRNCSFVDQLEVVQSELEESLRELNQKNRDIEKLKRVDAASAHEINRLAARIKELDQRAIVLTNEKNGMSSALETLENQRSSLTAENLALSSERDKLNSEKLELDTKARQLESEKEKSEEKVLQLEGEKEKSEEKVLQLESEKEKFEKKALLLETEKDTITYQLESLEKRTSSLSAENASLAEEREKLANEKKGLTGKVEELSSANETLSSELVELNEKLSAAAIERELLKAESLKAKDNIARMSADMSNSKDESQKVKAIQAELDKEAKNSEHLLQQLNQVQNELETYFKKYTELSNANAAQAKAAEPPPEPAPESQAAPVEAPEPEKPAEPPKAVVAKDIDVDFREYIDGENWYYAEHDGRWAGPDEISTVVVRPTAPGSYELTLDVVDAMAPEIATDLVVHFDGKPVQLDWKGKSGSSWNPIKRKNKANPTFPIQMKGKVTVEDKIDDDERLISIAMPQTISPASRGESDRRKLGIRVRGVHLKKI